MYDLILALHNFTRWLVLIATVYVLWRSWRGLRSGRYQALDRMAGVAFTSTVDLQLLLGILLLAFSPLMQNAWANLGAAMQNPGLRFFLAEHPVVMLAAAILAHVGNARVRRAATDVLKHRQALLFYGLSTLLILLAIPWWRPWLRF
ncbi:MULTISPECIES: hypothetical protein [unclassified Meiothermus]|uniref:hypothetical protein n=1 Tax=unclassified Meiothermus TaxID=370471 RepID=UPI000D7C362B|nr:MULTISPECIES: hypothetical protein [unclassified Meiothermus]PZA08150.1 hypothetical protein DNA98_03110 [Meiothermus sp. Pnk-1]RYM32299.1 hypothetical protein EWH23_14185 [Meiothermus sp. PNK-Is4]